MPFAEYDTRYRFPQCFLDRFRAILLILDFSNDISEAVAGGGFPASSEKREAKMKISPELIAVLNAEADRIAAAKIGDGLTVAINGGLGVFTVIRKNGTTITLRQDIAAPDLDCADPVYFPNHDGTTIEIAFAQWIDQDGVERRAWRHGDGGSVYLGRYPVIASERSSDEP